MRSKKILFTDMELEALGHFDLVVSDYETELTLTAWWHIRYRWALRKAISAGKKNKKVLMKKAKARTKETMKNRVRSKKK